MISNDDSTDGESIPHSSRNKGSISSIRVGSRSLPLYPLVIVCFGVVNIILMLTAVVLGVYCGKAGEISAPDEAAQILILEYKTLSEMKNEIIKSQDEAVKELNRELKSYEKMKLQVEQNLTLCDQLQRQIESLHVTKATLQSEITDTVANCGRCLSGWQLINSSCYLHSKSQTTDLKNWQDSRADCISRGGNLAVIDNLEEQINMIEFLQEMNFSQWPQIGAWIGLKYVQEKHSWMWLNNRTLHSEGYWGLEQPNNQEDPDGACVAVLKTKIPTTSWFDARCFSEKEWLCEKEPH